MPAIQPYIIEPIWEQFRALLPERKVDHPLGCHRPRIPDCVVFEKQVAASPRLRAAARKREEVQWTGESRASNAR